jgi:hypothetical protein
MREVQKIMHTCHHQKTTAKGSCTFAAGCHTILSRTFVPKRFMEEKCYCHTGISGAVINGTDYNME